ncbi:conserved hypothetical protein [Betalipothrixvirus acidiani]|uniref:Uncharacterized protein n=3 Tax=Betalipothrixvirus TaxID=341940 RepID=A7WKJ9_9VIRU|nr:hypothetical protein AFV6_gp45 [Acidianus filamentous virus 6]YP_001604321.1 hypothetical protein AFV8_gp40 [Acidianus filamentous virus 8]YP_001604386.1 hypothetical protein AFV3_gp44 [Acidianus filamentous virus 3]CAJ31534.1 conserved hypothetical protein [Acidianus filamentous virus 3]CAJ31599.1 conserved hypothetical protein [Acidianus filamentous virus 6]CAJ31717.1 conserved hypothetical protein [Acidianus filamentous virus 8]
MSYAQISSALTSVATNLVVAISNFLSGIASFIANNADLFVGIAIAGLVIGLVAKFASSLPFVGQFLSYLGL